MDCATHTFRSAEILRILPHFRTRDAVRRCWVSRWPLLLAHSDTRCVFLTFILCVADVERSKSLFNAGSSTEIRWRSRTSRSRPVRTLGSRCIIGTHNQWMFTGKPVFRATFSSKAYESIKHYTTYALSIGKRNVRELSILESHDDESSTCH